MKLSGGMVNVSDKIKESVATDLTDIQAGEFSSGVCAGVWEGLKWSYGSSKRRLDEIHKQMETETDKHESLKLLCEEQFHLGVMSIVKSVNESLKRMRGQ